MTYDGNDSPRPIRTTRCIAWLLRIQQLEIASIQRTRAAWPIRGANEYKPWLHADSARCHPIVHVQRFIDARRDRCIILAARVLQHLCRAAEP